MNGKYKNRAIMLGVGALLIMAAVFALYIHGRAAAIGAGVGEINGNIVGTAIGSYRGITEGVEKGTEAGENAGLSAEDTTADVKGTMESIGKLEVLAADVTLKNINKIGDTYEGLYMISGNAVFTVDLNNADISYSKDGSSVYIWIPSPEMELYLDQNSTEKLAEKQKFSLSVNAKDGLKAYLNSMTQTVDNVKDMMSNYESLMTAAKESAKTQVEQLATTLCGQSQHVQVEFK
jgi:hypothetical protein